MKASNQPSDDVFVIKTNLTESSSVPVSDESSWFETGQISQDSVEQMLGDQSEVVFATKPSS